MAAIGSRLKPPFSRTLALCFETCVPEAETPEIPKGNGSFISHISLRCQLSTRKTTEVMGERQSKQLAAAFESRVVSMTSSPTALNARSCSGEEKLMFSSPLGVITLKLSIPNLAAPRFSPVMYCPCSHGAPPTTMALRFNLSQVRRSAANPTTPLGYADLWKGGPATKSVSRSTSYDHLLW